MKHPFRLILAMLLALSLVAAACGDDDSDSSSSGDGDTSAETTEFEADVVENPDFAAGTTMARLADQGSIKIGTKFDQPGLGNVNLETGKPEGFDVAMGEIVAGQLGIDADKIEWVETVSANREAFIQNGTVDLVIATYTINDTRKQVVDFAGPYYVAGQDLLVRKDDDTINGPDDLAGKKVCAATGSTPIKNIRTNYPQAVPVEFDTYTECVDQLEAEQIDAVSTDDIILAGYASDPKFEGKFRVVGKTFSEEPYGMGLKKGDTEFRNFLNDTIEQAEDDGQWEAAFNSTLGSSGVEAPAPPPVNRY